MKTRNSDRRTFRVKESYRNLAFVAVFKKDQFAKSWEWKGSIDFDSGKVLFTGRGAFESEQQAKNHMLQFAHGCIDNRLGAT